MLNINDYIVETIAFAHDLPINRNYAILVFTGRKKEGTRTRLVFSLVRFESGYMTIIDEVSVPSSDVLKENSEILLASDWVNIEFKVQNARTVTVSYTDCDFLSEESGISEKFVFTVQTT